MDEPYAHKLLIYRNTGLSIIIGKVLQPQTVHTDLDHRSLNNQGCFGFVNNPEVCMISAAPGSHTISSSPTRKTPSPVR